ncbi:hypothetical protein VTJ49DRAFT_5558 [Mycothermus thermophilus]|uniref:Glycosyl transferase family 25 domain-containing protein n=1 Tax=Humicola insolens TaxID=85995 RepID=A0ABR3V2V7_HUMIN
MMLRARYIAVALVGFFVLLRWYKTPRQFTASDFGPLEPLNSTLGFQHIFAINLPSRTDRRDVLTLAAALTGLNISFMDGVAGADVPDSVLPGNGKRPMGLTVGNKGSWRAHMNVLQRIVQENIITALILEDDADWDVRLKSQMRVFAAAARAFTQPLSSSSSGRTTSDWQPPSEATLAEVYRHSPPTSDPVTNIPISRLITMDLPDSHLSPYGDDWDVLWLGHCGTDFPEEHSATDRSDDPWTPPPLRVTIPDDPTVPSPKHLVPHPFALGDALKKETFTGSDDEDEEWVEGEDLRRRKRYAPHTRVVHAPRRAVCTQAYAVSQRGARRLLWRFGVGMGLTAGWDLVLRDWCDGVYSSSSASHSGSHHRRGEEEKVKRRESGDGEEVVGDGRPPVCVTVQPPLFSHHFGKGKASDISAAGGGFWNRKGELTPYIRLSVRLNLGRLVNGWEPREQWED